MLVLGCYGICCARRGHKVGRSKVARLMRLMGIEALYRKPKTTKRHPGHKVYPYLLRNLVVHHSFCNFPVALKS